MDNMATPIYNNEDEMIQALQGLHMSKLLGFKDDGANEEGPNNIDISLMGNRFNEDYNMGGSEYLQSQLCSLIEDYRAIFSYSIKGLTMDVPPMEFTANVARWETNTNRVASRQVSTEKQTVLSALIDELLEMGVIRPSKTTAWSQAHLVWKPSGGWRFLIDYRALNKVTTN